MSLDFPNRNDWLARRYTPSALRRGRYITPSRGASTLDRGRNVEKRRVGKGWELFGVARAKTNTHRRMTQLSNRRLRQRGLAD